MSVTRHEVVLWAENEVERHREMPQQTAHFGRNPSGGYPRLVPYHELFEFVVRALRDPEPEPVMALAACGAAGTLPGGRYTCDRTRGHLGPHSWELLQMERELAAHRNQVEVLAAEFHAAASTEHDDKATNAYEACAERVLEVLGAKP